jgi:hypothetical protein
MDSTDSYPALDGDLRIAKEILDPAFERADAAALRFQKRYRQSELILIFGAVAAVALGAVAASGALPGDASQDATLNAWAAAEAVLTFALSAFAFTVRGLRWHQRWLQQRTVAETLRGEQFLLLGRLGVYANAEDARRALEIRVIDIERQGRGND